MQELCADGLLPAQLFVVLWLPGQVMNLGGRDTVGRGERIKKKTLGKENAKEMQWVSPVELVATAR
eukprot:SAG11_NODE_2400_length_3402_cov_46.821980_1_plen_66_part_00